MDPRYPFCRRLVGLQSWSGRFGEEEILFTLLGLNGPGCSVGITTDYGLDGTGSNPGGDEIFRPSRLALGSTQPPVKWILDLSQV